MIIFNLDGTLADCEHRRHFVDPLKNPEYEFVPENNTEGWKKGYYCNLTTTPYFGMPWKPDWKSFYEACDKDEPIESTIQLFKELYLSHAYTEIQIWSGRCESVKENTHYWLDYHINPTFNFFDILKMRPIGDKTPEHELKEKWLFERSKIDPSHRPPGVKLDPNIDFVFDSDQKSIEMWRRCGIFVFDCNQMKITR